MIEALKSKHQQSHATNPNYYYLGLGNIVALPPSDNVFMPSDAGMFFWDTLHRNFANTLTPQTHALDLGCGSGVIAMGLAMSGCRHLTVSDINPAHVAYAQEQFERSVPEQMGNHRFIISDLYDSLGGESYDLITFNCPGWATPTSQYMDMLKEASGGQYLSMFEGDQTAIRGISEGLKLLRPGGSIVLGLNSIGNISNVLLQGICDDQKQKTKISTLSKTEFPLLLYNNAWSEHQTTLLAQFQRWQKSGISFFRNLKNEIYWTYEVVCLTNVEKGDS